MTEYGRGTGPEPWHPDDPLFGDRGWSGGHDTGYGTVGGDPAPQAHWDPYAGGQPTHQPSQPYHQAQQQPDPQTGAWDTTGQYYTSDAYGWQQPADPYGAGSATGEYPAAYGTDQTYAPQPHPNPAYPPGPDHGPGHGSGYGAGYGSGYDPGAGPGGAAPNPAAPLGHPEDPGGRPGPGGQRPRAQPGRQPVRPSAHPDPETGWDPGPDQGESDFFRRRDDDGDGDEGDGVGRRGRRSSRRDERDREPRRGGLGCLVLALVLVGGVGGAGYYAYSIYQERFGPPPDYSGEGTGEVQVEIPTGASSSDIGNLLKKANVVKSHDAFVAAALANEDVARSIQPGVYILRLEMSAEAALELLTDPASLNVLTVPEGLRATQVYALIDEKLGVAEGTTEDVAANADLGLPAWAEGEVEGFLFPHRYDIGADTTPKDLLTTMVDRAEEEFAGLDLDRRAQDVGMSPLEVLTTASLVQAEAQQAEEFGKVSRVIHNRLDQGMRLEFDSTINYALGRSTLNTSIEDTQIDSPYNTYVEYGLPPGPIDNPGHQAIEAALSPTEGPWLYFVTVKPGDTRFTDDYDEHQRNVDAFNEAQEGDG